MTATRPWGPEDLLSLASPNTVRSRLWPRLSDGNRRFLGECAEDWANLQDDVAALAVKYLATGMWAEPEHALTYLDGLLDACVNNRPGLCRCGHLMEVHADDEGSCLVGTDCECIVDRDLSSSSSDRGVR